MIDRHKIYKWALIFGGWTAAAVFYTVQTLYQNAHAGQYPPWQFILKIHLIYCWIWAFLTPSVLWLGDRFPIEPGRKFSNLTIHFAASILFVSVHICLYAVSFVLSPQAKVPEFPQRIKDLLISDFAFCFFTYWILLCILFATKYYRAYRERALKAAQLSESLARTELQVLKMQLQPHFLFNTLNTISELVHEDTEAADKMITQLSGLLRGVLENEGTQKVTLQEELEFLNKYLDIEQIRYANRLVVQLNLSPNTLGALFPSMCLQPLVENAIRHSIAPRPEGGRITISSKSEADSLCLVVADDGPPISMDLSPNFDGGIGLSNTQKRLRALYGSDHDLKIRVDENSGFQVAIRIPLEIPSG